MYERNAQELEELGDSRAAAYQRSLAQAAKMKAKNPIDDDDFRFAIGEWVKRRRGQKTKFQTNWTGPYIIAGYGFPGTYWLMNPDGSRSHLEKWTNGNDEVESLPQEGENSDISVGILILDQSQDGDVDLESNQYYLDASG